MDLAESKRLRRICGDDTVLNVLGPSDETPKEELDSDTDEDGTVSWDGEELVEARRVEDKRFSLPRSSGRPTQKFNGKHTSPKVSNTGAVVPFWEQLYEHGVDLCTLHLLGCCMIKATAFVQSVAIMVAQAVFGLDSVATQFAMSVWRYTKGEHVQNGLSDAEVICTGISAAQFVMPRRWLSHNCARIVRGLCVLSVWKNTQRATRC